MSGEFEILLPTAPQVVLEEAEKGVYEIDGLYPGYGHTLGNALRRIILSSLPGAAVTSLKIEGVPHEFSTIEGVKEDIVMLLLNLKKVRFRMATDEPQKATISVKGPRKITAVDIKTPGQLEVVNKDQYIAELTAKTVFEAELTVEKGLGFVPKEVLHKNKTEIGVIAIDAIFSPIHRVSYEVENMRVGDKTNHNRLRISIETDGTVTPHDALYRSIDIMRKQLEAFLPRESKPVAPLAKAQAEKVDVTDVLKTRIDTLSLSARTLNALNAENIRTVGGLTKKSEEDLGKVKGIGGKGIKEIKEALSALGVLLKG